MNNLLAVEDLRVTYGGVTAVDRGQPERGRG